MLVLTTAAIDQINKGIAITAGWLNFPVINQRNNQGNTIRLMAVLIKMGFIQPKMPIAISGSGQIGSKKPRICEWIWAG